VSKQFELTKQTMSEQLLNTWTSLVSLIGCGFQLDKEQEAVGISGTKPDSELRFF
jgi:hypothetical protein